MTATEKITQKSNRKRDRKKRDIYVKPSRLEGNLSFAILIITPEGQQRVTGTRFEGMVRRSAILDQLSLCCLLYVLRDSDRRSIGHSIYPSIRPSVNLLLIWLFSSSLFSPLPPKCPRDPFLSLPRDRATGVVMYGIQLAI